MQIERSPIAPAAKPAVLAGSSYRVVPDNLADGDDYRDYQSALFFHPNYNATSLRLMWLGLAKVRTTQTFPLGCKLLTLLFS